VPEYPSAGGTAVVTAAVAGETSRAQAAEGLRVQVAGDLGGTPTAPQVVNSHVATVAVTSNYTALTTDTLILANAASAAVTVTLPTAVGIAGKAYTVRKTDNSTNPVTVDPNGTQTIDGALTYVMAYGRSLVTAISDGSNWQVVEKPVIDVKSFGAVGDGMADDTAAIQAAIDAATGSANPATSARTPVQAVYLPPGNYKITSDLNIRSVYGFHLTGAGPNQCRITPSGTGFTQAALFVNGSDDGVYEGFLIQGSGTEQLYNALRLDWVTASRTDAGCITNGTSTVANAHAQAYDVGATVTGTGIGTSGTATVVTATPGVGWTVSPSCSGSATVSVTVASANAASRSTSGNTFRDIRIKATNAVTYFSLEGNGGVQVDGTTLINVQGTGLQTVGSWSSSGDWQTCFALGNGTYGNNYNHRATGCDAIGFYYGWKILASSIALFGSEPANNFCDFYIQPGSNCTIENVQTQACGTFLQSPTAFPPVPVSFSDIQVKSTFLTGGVVASITGGTWHFKNFNASAVQNAGGGVYVPGLINIAGVAPTRAAIVTFDNLVMYGARTTCIVPGTNAIEISSQNYVNYNPNASTYTSPAAGDLLSVFTQPGSSGGSWVNLDQALITGASGSLVSLAVTGLTGATAGARLVGGTAGGAPSTGTWIAGDLVVDNSGNLWVCTAGGSGGSATWVATAAPVAPQVNFYMSSGTWTKPAGAKTVFTAVLGGGGGAGAGASGTSGTVQCGGGGAAGTLLEQRQFVASDLPSSPTTVPVTVGAGGNGGASVTGSSGNTSGSAGTAGSASSFGTYVTSGGGGQGSGGTTATGTGATSPAGVTSTNLGGGASASTTGGAGIGTNLGALGANGGSSGGGITSGAVAGNGAAGGRSALANDATGGTAGVVGGATPGSGVASALANGSCGPAPGSGAASVTGAAQAGANALANSGAGGSGGGASLNGNASGAGGNGGSGWVLAITYFQ
jgi:Pectate lyase superfamily protein